ncbi:DMT family transporter [Vibrio hyugaensis]|uniref:DMT family transporter n=1 Tax=Vibrio hyugaensis TaxID=1534743 RepID=UPI0005F00E26|nr:DMT family transporter [Vibrio hyugaensis]
MSTFLLTAIAMLAFAANSLLCRLALAEGLIDAGSFTLIRLLSGAVTLVFILLLRGNWRSQLPTTTFSVLAGLALFGYAALFSFAYINLTAGTGALLLFGAVQLTLLALYWWQGQSFKPLELAGITVSLIGFAWLMLPSATRPDAWSAVLMVVSGSCWAGFTALGKQAPSPSSGITWGFVVASIMGLLLSPFLLDFTGFTIKGILLAISSGAIASGLGYVFWYQVMQKLSLLQAAVSQLSVPVIALALGSLLLDEMLTLHSLMTSAIILSGITLVFLSRSQNASKNSPSQ